jgi:pimeloyl-ACP methyl ester carboxylesterase
LKALYVLALPLYAAAAGGWMLAVGLLLTAQTSPGRLMGLSWALLVPSLYLFSILPVVRRPVLPRAAAALLLAATLCGIWAAALAPDGQTNSTRFLSVWAEDAPRYALANIVPEGDQFTLGSYLATVDPYMDRPKTARLRGLFQTIYGEARTDPAFVSAGSAMPFAYRDLFGLDGDSHHHYALLPEGDGPHPTALFLHGSMGNFKGYQWVLKDLSEECGMAIVSPDFGAGFWADPDGLEVIDRTLDWIDAHPDLEAGPMPLMGLSNGGLGVTRAALQRPEDWTQLVYITGVLEPGRADELADLSLPVLVLDGGQDARIPFHVTDAAVSRLDQVTQRSWPDEDHFLFFSQPDEVVAAIAQTLCPAAR